MHRHRCGLLAAWSSAWLNRRVAYDDVIDAVVADEVHRVSGLPGQPGAVPLGWALSTLREEGETRLRAVLPVPGDPRGLPGPGVFAAAALRAGEGVVGGRYGMVPEGGGEGAVLWTVYPVTRPASPDPLSLPQADEELVMALGQAARTLSALDVAKAPSEAAEALLAGGPRTRRLQMPPGHDQRALGLLERARRLLDVLDLADADAPGGAVSGGQARARDAALRPLATAVRRALVAAYNA